MIENHPESYLVFERPDQTAQNVALHEGTVRIGREDGCSIQIVEVGISRRHAEIRFDPGRGGYVVYDLGSKNGTLVNGTPVAARLLEDGDEIICGAQRFVFEGWTPEHEETDPAAVTQLNTSQVVLLPGSEPHQPTTHYHQRKNELVLSQKRLKNIYNLSDRLTSLRSTDELLNDAMDICFSEFGFERGAIGLCPEHRRGIDWPLVRHATGAQGELQISGSIVARVLDHGERAVILDDEHLNTNPTESIITQGIRSALCVPLEYRERIIGVLYGDCVTAGRIYTPEDVDFLAAMARQVSIGIVNARLLEEQQTRIALEREIALARTIQQNLFPAELPAVDHLRVAAANRPGRQVSGDYYDVIELDDNRFALLVADVTGKGISSALLMANLQAAVKVSLGVTQSPSELMRIWNKLIHENTDPGMFVTCLLAIINIDQRTASIANAGHLLPMVFTGDQATSYEIRTESGMPLGLDPEEDYPTIELVLSESPCTLVMFSDGVSEAANLDNELFGTERLMDVMFEKNALDPVQVIDHIEDAIATFSGPVPQGDDITLVAAHLP